MSGELDTATATGSAAWAQHPHVTQVGGQAPSSSPWPVSSKPVHGSPAITIDTPDALRVSNPTMMAKANRRTP